MASEHIITEEPAIGARVLVKTQQFGTGNVQNAWRVLVDWGCDGDTRKAFNLVAAEVGTEEATAILNRAEIVWAE
ncbi:hypothetical protein [Streptomyces scabiei]|uniref:hypothetical protein n=1 Tax=Streptomyces scabiei TaxID=1930 RepID=UPI0029B72BA0|nr:hypothetical protein [Streptomyces scabiei]MDX3206078.1 hypothetical protein [Streptomyces scabiei]